MPKKIVFNQPKNADVIHFDDFFSFNFHQLSEDFEPDPVAGYAAVKVHGKKHYTGYTDWVLEFPYSDDAADIFMGEGNSKGETYFDLIDLVVASLEEELPNIKKIVVTNPYPHTTNNCKNIIVEHRMVIRPSAQ